MANTNSPDGGGEKLQIAILTFFMTAGGFLLLTLVFAFYFNPRLDTRMKKAEKEYVELCKLLQQDNVRRLRQQDRLNQEKGGEQDDIKTLISENLSRYGIQYREFRSSRPSKKKGGITEIAQPITLQPAPMTPILQFVAAVQASRKSIRVASLDLTRNKRAAGEDSWQASVMFIDYVIDYEKGGSP